MDIIRFFILCIYFISVLSISILLRFLDFTQNYCFYNCGNESIIEYDYIIVGGGSAGSVVANRLAMDRSKKIALFEAGKYYSDLFNVPAAGILLHDSPFDWKYRTVPQENACKALHEQSSRWPTGKILGGTSMLNNMIYNRGHKEDFDEWFKDDETYNYSNILYYFKKLESDSIHISDVIFNTTFSGYLLQAARWLGYPILQDNLNCENGYNKPKVNLQNGKRWTSANTLMNKKHQNLDIKLGHEVEKVLFKSNYEAYGVKYSYLGKKFMATAKLGVVLCAGVIGTPKILMLSGIGKKEDLKQLGIVPKIDLPVGDNLQDHLTTAFDLVLLNKTLDLSIAGMLSPLGVWNYFINGKGPLTTTGCDLLAFFNTKNKTARPNLQFMVIPLSLKEDNGIYLRRLMGIPDDIFSNYFSATTKPAVTILPVLLHPKSRGYVRLRDNNPKSQPLINPKYLSHPQDVQELVQGIQLIKKLVDSPPLEVLGAEFNTNPFPGCTSYKFDTAEYWECYVRHLTMTAYHPVGTCKMGHHLDSFSVVDFQFKVKETNKLFVVDGSVLPTLTSGNVNGAILMLAEMASDAIKRTEYLNTETCSVLSLFRYKNVICENKNVNGAGDYR